jgi:hypothetical protein
MEQEAVGLMIWIYERGDATMTLGTRFNRESNTYELIWHEADGSTRVETFDNESSFRSRLTSVSNALSEQRWRLTGQPTLDPDGWKL